MRIHGYKTKVGIVFILASPFILHFYGSEYAFFTYCSGMAISIWGLYWKTRRTKKVMKSA